ncbi:DEAD/DEAH box helicase [Adlercreutzia faecimuris]|uniref:DEAD/DEAH box helicase n=1 Tax=Adlercreutzia faecimuris TaxID=2897341 RepID=UPI002412BA11|nr:DEAD/DEAH box helicase [Adlercreutzia sp. JBNU-10]
MGRSAGRRAGEAARAALPGLAGEWFAGAFEAPTPVQARAWEAIARGDDALVIAPTGSGKTLAAFLFAIDRLMGEKAAAAAAGERWARGVRVLYVSPMKALGADVEKNLRGPLDAIAGLAAASGGPAPEVRTAMRTGDTTAEERRKIVRNPPDILITTPESLYLMLTSQAREALRAVETVIVDEVHALAGDKRGAHLGISLERLDDLLPAPAQRVGLSATVRPRDEVARFLGGARPVTVVAQEEPPCLDMEVRVPVRDMTAVPALGRGAGRAPRRAPAEEAWKSDRALRAALGAGPADHPDSRLGSSSIWPHIEAAILDEVLAHRSTIVFVNSRGLAEKLTARLNELYARRLGADAPRSEPAGWWTGTGGQDAAGADAGLPGPGMRSDMGGTTGQAQGAPALVAKAHHGSVSKEKRLAVERELKAGELPCVVATASLELGIDMGSIDLVIQVAAPPSVASGLQRVGRANHQVGGRSRGLVYPRTRTEVVDAAVMAEGMRAGAIEATRLVSCPLDVLAQQTVAAVAMAPEGLAADAWFATVTRAANFSALPRAALDGVIAMLAGRYGSGDVAEFAPRILWDGEAGLMRPLPGSQRLAVTAAGTIPDRGMFPVVLPEGDARQGRRRVGELDEEMVMESRVGDVIALGTSTWRIREIGADRVMVEPAPGRAARLPFWHGDAPARPAEAGRARGAFLRAADAALRPGAGDEAPAFDDVFERRLADAGLDGHARGNLAALLAAQRAATGAVPTDRVLVVEQCADETGDWRVILHSPLGRRVHEPWALAVARRARAELGFDCQAAAADDGIVVRVPMTAEALPGADLFLFGPDEAEAVVREAVGDTALFAARFRECAARALLMTPAAPGRRAPLWQQRLRGGQLLEAARREPGFPLILEAARECLAEAFDLPALREALAALAAGTVRLAEARTAVPSPFAAPLVFGYLAEHLYEGDLPHAERRASLLSVDPALLGELLGGGSAADALDPEAVAEVESELQRTAPHRRARGPEGASELLRQLGPLTAEEVAARLRPPAGEAAPVGADEADLPAGDAPASLADALGALRALEDARRAFPTLIGGEERWAAADDAARLRAVAGAPVPAWALAATLPAAGPLDADGPAPAEAPRPLDALVARFARTHALFGPDDVAAALGLGPALVAEPLERLASEGRLVRLGGGRWADAGVLRRLRARSLSRARDAVRPVPAAAYASLLLDRQGVPAAGQAPALRGVDGVAQVIAQFEGAFLPMALWESEVLPARVPDYRPAMLDELVASGEVLWAAELPAQAAPARPGRGASAAPGPARIALFPTDSPLAPLAAGWGDVPAEEAVPEPGAPDSAAPTVAGAVRRVLAAEGPCPLARVVEGARRALAPEEPSERAVAEALAALAWAGEATADGLALPRAGGLAPEPASAARSGGQEPPARRRASSRRGRGGAWAAAKAQARSAVVARQGARAALDAALAGRWSLLAPAPGGDTLRAVALAESALDRYGVVTRDTALLAGVPGGLPSLMPVLRRMEETGELVRGPFVAGLGPAQFAERETVEALRARAAELAAAPAGPAPVTVLAADDPACLLGAAVPWPDPAALRGPATPDAPAFPRPSRREGALVALAAGEPVLWAAPRLKSLIAFTDDAGLLAAAARALVGAMRARLGREGPAAARRKVVVEAVNGEPVLDTPLAAALQDAGLVRLPEGLRLYADPF